MAHPRLPPGPSGRSLAVATTDDLACDEWDDSAGRREESPEAVEVLDAEIVDPAPEAVHLEAVHLGEELRPPRRTPRHTGVTVVVSVGTNDSAEPAEGRRDETAISAWSAAPRLDQDRRAPAGRPTVPRYKAVASYAAHVRRRD